MQVAQRILKIEASQSLVMAARAKAMKAAGVDVVSMSLGEPDMDTPKHVRLAAQEAVDNHWSHYGPVAGIPALREAVANYQNALTGNAIPWIADDVVVSAGAKMAIYNAIQAVINPGDEVVIPMPSWVSYSEMVKLAEGVVVPVNTKYEDRYCLTPEQLKKALTKKTRMIILCSPNNPTGSVYSASELEALVAALRDFPDVFILSDEIYNALSYGVTPTSFSYFPDLAERLIIINGVSKAYGDLVLLKDLRDSHEFSILLHARISAFQQDVELLAHLTALRQNNGCQESKSRAIGQLLDGVYDIGSGVLLHLLATHGREGLANAGKEQPQVVVNLGRSAHGTA